VFAGANIGARMQIHDFVRAYESKSDEELLLLAKNVAGLSLDAQAALHSELSRRGLTTSVAQEQLVDQRSRIVTRLYKLPSTVVGFAGSVTHLYRSHFWLFVKLTGPAVLIGYFAITLSQNQSREIFKNLPRGTEFLLHRAEILEIWLLRLSSTFVSWAASCVAFAAIFSAVAQIKAGASPQPTDCFAELRTRSGAFARICLLLYMISLLAFGLGLVLTIALWTFFSSHLSLLLIQVLTYALSAAVIVLLSRFGLAIPAVLADNCNARQSIFRSDEMTQGKWLVLTALVTKSVLGGYIAAMLPFWSADFLWSYIQVPTWILIVLSIAGVIVTEPFMFIGFSLLYLDAPQQSSSEPAMLVTTR
jgi:hypothetical protein